MPPFHHLKASVGVVHQLTPRRKSDALPARKLITPDAVKDGEAAVDDRHRHRVGEQQQHTRHQLHPSKQPKNPDATSSSSDDDSDSDEDDGSDDDDDDSTSSSSTDQAATTTTRASLIASLHPGTNTDGLSDYELLRLQKIQRNEAKLASLGLCGITSKNKNGGGGGGGSGTGSSSNGGTVNESAKKAANTRRKNAIQAKKMMELHERSPPQRAARPLLYAANPIPNPNSRIEQWKSHYSELQSFITKYGSYDVLTRTIENGKYKSLCDWWNRQRKQYTKYKIGVKSTLGDEQIDLLDSLDGRTRGIGGGRGGGGGHGGGNTSRQLWKASTDSETDEDEYTWERINREEEEDDEEYEENVEASSTEEEEVDIGTVDSYSDQSSSSARLNRRNVSVMKPEKNRMRRAYSTGESKARKQKRKLISGSTRSRSSESGRSVVVGERLSTRTKRMRGSAIVSSLEKIGPTTNVVENDSNSHRTERRSRSHRDGRRYAYHRSYSSDEEDNTEDDEEEDSFSTMEHDEYGPVHRVVSPDIRRYGHRSNSHRQKYRRNREDEHHHRHGRNRWHRPVSEIIITPPKEQHQLSRLRHHRHHRRIHHQQQEHYHHQQHQQDMQQIKEREAILREYGQLYKRQCELQEQSSKLMLELQGHSTDRFASASSASAVPTTNTTAAAIAAAQASILAAYTTLTTTTTTTTTIKLPNDVAVASHPIGEWRTK